MCAHPPHQDLTLDLLGPTVLNTSTIWLELHIQIYTYIGIYFYKGISLHEKTIYQKTPSDGPCQID